MSYTKVYGTPLLFTGKQGKTGGGKQIRGKQGETGNKEKQGKQMKGNGKQRYGGKPRRETAMKTAPCYGGKHEKG